MPIIIIARQQPYQELGPNYFDERNQQRVERQLVRRLEWFGYLVGFKLCAKPTEVERSGLRPTNYWLPCDA